MTKLRDVLRSKNEQFGLLEQQMQIVKEENLALKNEIQFLNKTTISASTAMSWTSELDEAKKRHRMVSLFLTDINFHQSWPGGGEFESRFDPSNRNTR